MLTFTGIRLAIDALISRFVVGARGRRFWRMLAAIIGADVIVALAAPFLIYWMANMSAGSATHETFLTLLAGALMLIAALLIWEGAVMLAARGWGLTRQRVGLAATALLLGLGIPIAGVAAIQSRGNAPAQVTRWEVAVAGLPAAFDGLRVACIGDLHLDRATSADAMRRRLRPLASLDPDLILFVGDYATGDPRYEKPAAAIIAGLRAPLGVYAVLGNHDRWVGEENSLRALREAGVRVLVNEKVALRRGADRLYLAGVNDPYTGADDLDGALSTVPAGSCVILLAHTPDIIAKAQARAVALVLAGHTHGGQVSLPLVGPPVVLSEYGSKYAHGLFREGRTAMFVTRGVGEIFPQVRFNCPREIALLTLRRG